MPKKCVVKEISISKRWIHCARQKAVKLLDERLMMSGRPKHPKYARNKNVIVIGGSGSGKTRFYVKPNLMQMPQKVSYVVTDPKTVVVNHAASVLMAEELDLGAEGRLELGEEGLNFTGAELTVREFMEEQQQKRSGLIHGDSDHIAVEGHVSTFFIGHPAYRRI